MARPIKDGFDYFPKDTGFYSDDKVRLLRAEFGAKGMYTLDYILCEIYGKNGYFIKWDNNTRFLVSDGAGCGCSPEYISEFILGCLRCSFFDERVLNAFGVLTSAGIQRRYIRMFNSRDEIPIIKEYWLLDVNDKKDVPPGILNKLTFKKVFGTGNALKTTENPFKSTGNAQSKVKDTIVSQRESNARARSNPHPTLNEVKAFFSAEGLSSNPDIFFNHYKAVGWKNISDWKAKAREWSLKEKKPEKADYGAYDLELYEKMLDRKD